MQKKITMVRMRPRNPKREGMGMRTYTSASGARYSIGVAGQPSPIKIVDDPAELEELRSLPQFEFRTFRNRAEMDEFVAGEVAQLVRSGYNAVVPHVEELRGSGIPSDKKKAIAAILDDDDDDVGNGGTDASGHAKDSDDEPDIENRGRVPSKAAVDERLELVRNVEKTEEAHAEAIEKGRSDATIDKWEKRLEKAREALARFDKKQAELSGEAVDDEQE